MSDRVPSRVGLYCLALCAMGWAGVGARELLAPEQRPDVIVTLRDPKTGQPGRRLALPHSGPHAFDPDCGACFRHGLEAIDRDLAERAADVAPVGS